jgi:hypothetical protein
MTPSGSSNSIGGVTLNNGNISMTPGYRHFEWLGGNSYGYLYGAFNKYGDGVHIGYNFYNDNTNNVIPVPAGSTSRMTFGYGTIACYTGAINAEPTNLGYSQISNGNVGINRPTPECKLTVYNPAGTVTSSNIDIAVIGGLNNGFGQGGSIGFACIGSATAAPMALIKGYLNSYDGNGEHGGLSFQTRQNGSATMTERMLLTHDGLLQSYSGFVSQYTGSNSSTNVFTVTRPGIYQLMVTNNSGNWQFNNIGVFRSGAGILNFAALGSTGTNPAYNATGTNTATITITLSGTGYQCAMTALCVL